MSEEAKPKQVFEPVFPNIHSQGEPTDSKYASGPLEDRSCTDIICCLLFLVFIGGMGYVTYVAFDKGDYVKLLAPFASDGIFDVYLRQTMWSR